MAEAMNTTDTLIFDIQLKNGSGKGIPEDKKEVDALATSILGLQQASKKLRDERKLLDTSTEEGKKRIKEINVELDKNNKTIKDNSSALEKQRLNIGNYTGALDKLIPGLGATVNGIAGMTKASLAFIATPIGLVIAALGLALAAVTKYFTSSEEGADQFTKIAAKASAIVGVLVDRVVMLGGAIVAFLSGDFEGGLNKLEGAFTGVGDEIAREVKLAGELADMLDQLEERELKYGLAVSATANEIKKLIIESKNRTLSEAERIAKLDEATQKEIALNKELLGIQNDKIKASALQLQADFSHLESAKKTGETDIDFAKRLVANEDILIGRRQELAELIKGYDQAQGESLNLQEQIQNKRDAIEQKAADEKRKRDEQAQKESDDAREARIAALDAEIDYAITAEKRRKDTIKAFGEDFKISAIKDINDVAKIRDKQRKDDEKRDKEKQQAFAKNRDADLKGQDAALQAGTNLLQQAFGRNKAIAIAETVINTVRGIVRAVAEYPFPYSLIVGALVGAAGTIQTARIAGLKFAEGGWVDRFANGGNASKRGTFSGPPHSGGGIDYIRSDGKHRINVEGGENFYVLKKTASDEINRYSAINERHGGASWTGRRTWYAAQGGQIETRQAEANANSANGIDRTVRTIMQNMPPTYVVAQDVSQVNNTSESIKQRATVI
jgi:hypothetical protein